MKIENLEKHIGQKVYFTLEEKCGDCFQEYFTSETEAIDHAKYLFGYIAESAKKNGASIAVCSATVLEDGNVQDFDEIETVKYENPMLKDIESSAAALYNGGWRREDKDWMMSEYDLTEEDAEMICKEFDKMEANHESIR